MFERIADMRPELLTVPGLNESGEPWSWGAYASAIAISLAYGVLVATTITLFIVPCGYLILDDLTSLRRRASNEAQGATAVQVETLELGVDFVTQAIGSDREAACHVVDRI